MNRLPILHVLIHDDSFLDIEMGSFAKNINKEVCGVIDFFLSLTKYDERKVQNILILMLNLDSKVQN